MRGRATQDRLDMMESSEKDGLLEKGLANHFSILENPMNSTKWQKDKISHKISPPGQQVFNMLLGYFGNPVPSLHDKWGNSGSSNRFPLLELQNHHRR